MNYVLAGARAKIERAREHFENLKSEADAFLQAEPYRLVPERDDDKVSARVHFDREPPYDRWGLILGDCVHNLRSALDHAVQEVAAAFTGQDPPPDYGQLQFPILTEADYWTAKSRRYQIDTNHLPSAAIDIIEAAQPYHRGDKTWPFLVVQNFDNADKHRKLAVTVLALQRGMQVSVSGDFTIAEDGQVGPTITIPHALITGAVEQNAVAASADDPDVDMDAEVTLAVHVGDVPLPDGSRARYRLTPLVNTLGNRTTEVVNNLAATIS